MFCLSLTSFQRAHDYRAHPKLFYCCVARSHVMPLRVAIVVSTVGAYLLGVALAGKRANTTHESSPTTEVARHRV